MNSHEIVKEAVYRQAFKWLGKKVTQVATAASNRFGGGQGYERIANFGRTLTKNSVAGRTARARVTGGVVGGASGVASAPEGESFTGTMLRGVAGAAGGGYLGKRFATAKLKPGSSLSKFRRFHT